MHKARRDILNVLNTMDVLIEIVDARVPFSSQNPLIGQWRQKKPTIVVLGKTDLADAEQIRKWQNHLEQQDNMKVFAGNKYGPSKIKKIPQACLQLAARKSTGFKAVNAMIVGIPNVGKSTLINILAGKAVANVGNEPAVTKRQQKINLDNRVVLHDTPGILWPKIENPHSGYRLAMVGSIKNTAIDYEDIGFYAVDYLLTAYPQRLLQRYQLNRIPASALECLETLGARCGARRSGDHVNLHRASEILIHDLRAGNLGALCLETPDMIRQELAGVEMKKKKQTDKKTTRGQKSRHAGGK